MYIQVWEQIVSWTTNLIRPDLEEWIWYLQLDKSITLSFSLPIYEMGIIPPTSKRHYKDYVMLMWKINKKKGRKF